MQTEPKTYHLRVLGCKVNQYEAAQIEQLLQARGLTRVPGQADLIVLHGCAVTREAQRKSHQTLRALRRRHPAALVILSGCAAAAAPDAQTARTISPGPDWIERLDRVLDEHMPSPPVNLPLHAEHFLTHTFGGHRRAFLKIQDGCSIHCSYCIVPALRGPPRDKPLPLILREARELIEHGYHEIVVCGVSVGLYGTGQQPALPAVLRALLELDGLQRVRLSSLHPRELTGDLLDVWRESPRMAPHIHMPLQSGSDRILAAMRRGYTADQFEKALDRFKNTLDKPSITTDIITGFPGETEADFHETLRIARRIQFADMHIFPFSARPGTDAASMTPEIPPETARQRAAQLREIADRTGTAYRRSLIGMQESVLLEKTRGDSGEGHGARYIRIRIEHTGIRRGDLIPVRLSALDPDLTCAGIPGTRSPATHHGCPFLHRRDPAGI